ncbi:MAG: HTTM domain-containing protein [Planctomycetales bacterium]
MMSAADAIEWMTRLAGFCAAILSVEVLIDQAHYSDAGLLGWPVMQSRHRWLVTHWAVPLLNLFLAHRRFLALMGLRLLAAAGLVFADPEGGLGLLLLLTTTATGALYQLRTPFGTDGADQMNLLTLGALSLERLCASEVVRHAALWFVALQLILSYFVAGMAKLRGEEWRSGRAPWGIFTTKLYGIPRLGRWLMRHPRVSWLMSWGIILFEIGFPAVFVAPRPVALAFLVLGLSFHVLTAFVMGLNTFFWAFLAAYPALVWCLMGRGPG